jgi:hypothetical protein
MMSKELESLLKAQQTKQAHKELEEKNRDVWKTITGIIWLHLNNHPNEKNHKIEFTTKELNYIYDKLKLNELTQVKNGG